MTPVYNAEEMRKRLRSVLEEKNISLRVASLGGGQGDSYLAGILAPDSERDPQVSKLIAICDFLEVPLSWVLYGYELPDGSDEIFQLLAENPDRLKNIAALLRG